MKPGRDPEKLVAELHRQAEGKRDYLAPSNQMMLVTNGGRTELDLDEAGAFPLRETAHGHLAEHVGIPKAYYDRMREHAPALFRASVNLWLSRDTRSRMVRTLDGQARALLSDRYRPLDNWDLAGVALPVLVERGFQIVSAEVTERRFYLKAVTPRIAGEVKPGDLAQAGVVISNSEIGDGTLSIFPLAYFLACSNGLVFEDASFRKHHVGKNAEDLGRAREFFRDETRAADDRAFWMKVRDVLAGTLDTPFFEQQLGKLRAAAGEGIQADPVAVVEVTARRLRLGEEEKRQVLGHFLAGHNGRSELTRYGLVQAVTRASQDADAYDRASELEQLGGRILEMPRGQWQELAEARG